MSTREVARRVHAWAQGRPLPRYSTLHQSVGADADVLLLAFVRMAGESRPWGIAWGRPGSQPMVRSVPDGRDLDAVAWLSAEFAETLLDHLQVVKWSYEPVTDRGDQRLLRQVWVPNDSHAEMLHHLSYAYTFTKYGDERRDALNALGRACGWLFRESTRVGNQHLVVASQALRDSYAIPAEDVRTAHLGYSLAWLGNGDREQRMAAALEAEALTVGITLDPKLDRDVLDRLVSSLRDGGDTTATTEPIATVLSAELLRRWQLTEEARQVLLDDPRAENAGLPELRRRALDEQWWQFHRLEAGRADEAHGPVFVPAPETDRHGSAAASRYMAYEAAAELQAELLVHDDPELLEELLEDGHAERLEVVMTYDASLDKAKHPSWQCHRAGDAPLRIREGSRLRPIGSMKHEAQVVRIDTDSTGLVEIELEWTVRKTMALEAAPALKPLDHGWIGEIVDFVVSTGWDLQERRGRRIWSAAKGPGAWLTHSQPRRFADPDLVDDVVQIEGGGA